MKFMMLVCTDSDPDSDRRDEIDDGVAFTDERGRLDGDILACADLDAAIDVVRGHPMARMGRIELRPFGEFSA